MVKVIDMFAGGGGFSAGAELAGCEVVWAGNHDDLAVETYARNHPDTRPEKKDLLEYDWRSVPEMDIVLASPACQGHSQGATRGGDGRRGTAPHHDALRSTAWAVVSCLEVHRPPAAVIENVVEFTTWILYPAWRQAMAALGYAVAENVIDAADLGVPQHRRRLFLTAVRGKTPLEVPKPAEEHQGILGCLDLNDDEGWEPVRRKSKGVRARVAKGRSNFPRGPFVTQHVTGHPGRDLRRPLGTVTTKHHWGIVRHGLFGDEMRMFKIREYKRAMAFPDSYWLPDSTNAAVKLLGNAVSPPVANYVIGHVVNRI